MIVLSVRANVNESIDAVIARVEIAMDKCGYSKSGSIHYKTAQNLLKHFYMQLGETDYSERLMEQYVEHERKRYENGELSYDSFCRYKRYASIVTEYLRGNTISLHKAMSKNLRQVNDTHQVLLDEFKNEVLLPRYNHKVNGGKISSVRQFLLFIEGNLCGGVETLTRSQVSDFLTETAQRRRPSMRMLIDDVKQFVDFLISRKIVSKNLITALDVYAPKDKRIYPGFSTEESNRILASVDRSTKIGKRDYAMLMLAKHTGIRGIDIQNLKLQDIIWRKAEIHITQSKTRKILALPLDASVGNAIADYILNARPNVSVDTVFLRCSPPFVGLTYTADIVRKYAKISGVEQETNAQIGFHSFRRALGVSLLEAEIPISLISEILGHAKQNSLKAYIALDIEQLKKCHMPMNDFYCCKEELY